MAQLPPPGAPVSEPQFDILLVGDRQEFRPWPHAYVLTPRRVRVVPRSPAADHYPAYDGFVLVDKNWKIHCLYVVEPRSRAVYEWRLDLCHVEQPGDRPSDELDHPNASLP